MLALLYGKFTQDNTCQILLESAGFYGRSEKIPVGVFLGVNNYIICISVVLRCSIDVAGAALKTEEG